LKEKQRGGKGSQQGERKSKESAPCTLQSVSVYIKECLRRLNDASCLYTIIITIGMNVVGNLNSVYVINKPCMSSRNMCLLPRATLHSDSEQFVFAIRPILS
jgi:hypothetical protein